MPINVDIFSFARYLTIIDSVQSYFFQMEEKCLQNLKASKKMLFAPLSPSIYNHLSDSS